MVSTVSRVWRAQRDAVRRQREHEALMYEQVAQLRDGPGLIPFRQGSVAQALEQFRVEVPDAMKTSR